MNQTDRKLLRQSIEQWKQRQLIAIGGRYPDRDNRNEPLFIKNCRKQVIRWQKHVNQWINKRKRIHDKRVSAIEKRANDLQLEASFGDPKKVITAIK